MSIKEEYTRCTGIRLDPLCARERKNQCGLVSERASAAAGEDLLSRSRDASRGGQEERCVPFMASPAVTHSQTASLKPCHTYTFAHVALPPPQITPDSSAVSPVGLRLSPSSRRMSPVGFMTVR